MLRHRDLLLQLSAMNHLFFFYSSLYLLWLLWPRPCPDACVCVFFFFFVCVCPPRALPGMMQWIRSQRPGESGINIITADFVELGEFISAVITLNYHLDDDDDDATWEPLAGGRGAPGSTVATIAGGLVCALTLFSLAFISRGELHGSSHFI